MFERFLIWVVIGVVTGLVYWKTQQWSLNLLNPHKAALSTGLIISGTFLRWIFIAAVFIFAVNHSYLAIFIVFSMFMLTRLIFVLRWQGWLRLND